MGKKKDIKLSGAVVEKKPKTPTGSNYATAHPCWRVGRTTDKEEWGVMSLFDQWPWKNTDPDALSHMFFFKDVLPALRSIETQTWGEIDRATHNDGKSKNHFIGWAMLSQKAKELLSQMKLDDSAEKLYSLRIGGKKRIVGIRQDNCLDILWICREHDIYPSRKSRT